jgi:hypothetical protein
MGLPLQVDLPGYPSLGSPLSVDASWPFIQNEPGWIAEPGSFSHLRRQYLVTMFRRDAPGILIKLSRSLKDGIFRESHFPVKFTVKGTTSAAIHGTFSTVMVVEAYADTPVAERVLRSIPDSEIMAALKLQLKIDLDDSNEEPPEVRPFKPITSDLFVQRRFSEYRFGMRGDVQGLARVAQRFTQVLSKNEIPVVYLNFPDPWLEKPRTEWLRVGVGLRPEPMSAVDIDLAALDIASDLACSLEKYDSSIQDKVFGGRFRRLADHSNPGGSERSATPSDKVDVVFVEGRARIGYVAQMLEDGDGLIGGATAVLAGHTVAIWLLKLGDGERFMASLAGTDAQRGEGGETAQPRLMGSVQATRPTTAHCSELWVCWRCSERPGILETVLAKLLDITQANPTLKGINVDQAVCRVIAQGFTCAGKLRLTVHHKGEPTELEHHDIEKAVQEAISFAVEGWEPDRPDWLERPVLVRGSEPSEDPWASLSLTSAATRSSTALNH